MKNILPDLLHDQRCPMVCSTRERPEAAHNTPLGINNATMLIFKIQPGQKNCIVKPPFYQ